jgi:hypothetical protein
MRQFAGDALERSRFVTEGHADPPEGLSRTQIVLGTQGRCVQPPGE